jgi:hypothetical protein
MFGKWETSPKQYASDVVRWRADIGRMDWAAIQDWMCEPHIVAATGKTVRKHQSLTVDSFLRLRDIAPGVPWLPVLQGWEPGDYVRHFDAYARAGVALESLPLVGVGSMCRRQGTADAARILDTVAALGVNIHAFGVKTLGLLRCRSALTSADSMAWSYRARKRARLPGCRHQSCSNCYVYAMAWRRELLRAVGRSRLPSR